MAPASPLGLLLEGAEGSKIALSVHDLLDGVGTQCADQLVLQIDDAHVEAQPFHLRASEVGAEAGPLEPAAVVTFLCRHHEAGQPDVQPVRAEQPQEPADRLRAPDRHDGNALGIEIAATSLSERLERALVADPFDEDDRFHSPYLRESSERGERDRRTVEGVRAFGVAKKTDFPDWHGFGTPEQNRRWGLTLGFGLLVCFAVIFAALLVATILLALS